MDRLRNKISCLVLSIFLVSLAQVTCILLDGCGGGGGNTGGGGSSTPAITSIGVSCSPNPITTSQTSNCSATVRGTGNYSSDVTWAASGGTVTSTGVFTPSAVGTAKVTATSKQDSTYFAQASVTVSVAPSISSVSVTCSPSVIPVSQSTLCTANVQGTGAFDPTVNWSATKGTITSSGNDTATFTGPSSIASVTITAISTFDKTKSGSTVLNVTTPPPSGSFQLGGPDGEIISALAADPTSPGTVYASIETPGYPLAVFLKSSDGAKTWQQTGTSIDSAMPVIWSMAVSSHSGTVYVGGYSDSIYKSTDHAATWTALSTPVGKGGGIYDIVIDPLNENNLYLLAESSTSVILLYMSKDQGATWSQISTSSGCQPYPNIVSLVADPKNEGVLYCTGGTSSAIYLSSDSGSTWAKLSTITSPYAAGDITLDPTSPEKLFVKGVIGTASALFMSTDGGHTWTKANSSSLLFPTSIVVNPKNPQEIFAGDSNGLEVSEDGGSTWTNQSNLASLWYLTYIPGNSGATLLGSAGVNMYSSADNGKSWAEADPGTSYLFSESIAIDPNQPTTLFMYGVDGFPLSRSTDAGATWKQSYSGTASYGVVVIDPGNSQHILANSYPTPVVSNDGGTTWQPITFFGNTIVTTINFDPNTPSTIYAGVAATSGSGFIPGVAKSVDGGNTWTPIHNGLPSTPSSNAVVWAFAISPDSKELLVSAQSGDTGGLYRSTDGGASWSQVLGETPFSIAFDHNQTGAVYASGESDAVKSTDGGVTWSQLQEPSGWASGGVSGPINVVVDPKFAGQVFMIPFYGPVAWSPDHGSDWYLLSNGLSSETYLSNTFATPAIAPTSPEVLYIPSSNRTLVMLTLDH